MKATLTITVNLTDENFSNEREKELFVQANEEQKLVWLQDKAFEVMSDAYETDIKLIKLEM